MLVVGPNLSVDQTVAVPVLRTGTIHRVPTILRLAGGKGTNLARALRVLDEDSVLVGFAGGPTGQAYAAYLAAEGIRHQLVPTAADTRVCFSIADEATGAQTEFYEAGMPVADAEVAALIATATARMAGMAPGDWVALTGSLPPGAPADLYAQLIVSARTHGLRALLDAREPALGPGIAAAPELVKINQDELAAWACEPGGDIRVLAEMAARALAPHSSAGVVITRGAQGALALAADGSWLVAPPTAGVVRSPVGSGDSAAAGLLVGMRHGLSLPEATRLAVAAGTANAAHLGAGRFTAAEVRALAPRCTIAPVVM